MSIFGKIKDSIFGKKPKPQETPATAPATKAAPQPTGNAWADAPVVEQQARPVIDIENNLDNMPGADRLNWRTSIVDLMKLLGLDSGLASRKQLADELHYTGDKDDSASMNIWLHKQVMQKLAENGGKVPDDLKH